MKLTTLALSLLWIPLPLLACGPGETLVFSCPTDRGKHIEVCQANTAIHYTYGKPGQAPELRLSEKNETFVWEHGEGVSAGIGDDLIFGNGATRYMISHVSNFDDRSDVNAHLTVMQHGKDNISIECVAKRIRFNPTAIKAQQREMTEGTPSF
jgi:hypothetical protein